MEMLRGGGAPRRGRAGHRGNPRGRRGASGSTGAPLGATAERFLRSRR